MESEHQQSRNPPHRESRGRCSRLPETPQCIRALCEESPKATSPSFFSGDILPIMDLDLEGTATEGRGKEQEGGRGVGATEEIKWT
jgi:hypothetical protein